MKVVILAGGYGTRISEESYLRPKPMIEIGEKPMLWHIMKLYSHYGFHDFIICLGYKAYVIKEFFANYYLHSSNVSFDLGNDRMTLHKSSCEPWKVTLVDTGLNTMTGGRIKRIAEYLDNEPFFMTYGDGVSDIDINALLAFHKSHGKKATLSAIQPEGRFGILDMEGNEIKSFREKNKEDSSWINGGFMVLEPEVLDLIKDDDTIFEQEPMEALADEGQLMAYRHKGFWRCMDTQRDKQLLEDLWAQGKAGWRVWTD